VVAGLGGLLSIVLYCVCRHQAEASRLRGEIDAAREKAAADTAAARQEAADQVAAAEARAHK
jgi:hypothetical protein